MAGTLGFDVLAAEEKQLNDYVRHVSQLTLAWFTFFGTTNLAGLAWSASALDTPTASEKYAIYLLGTYFVIQSALGLIGVHQVRQHLLRSHGRLSDLLDSYGPECTAARVQTTPKLYADVCTQLMLGLVSFILLWLVMIGLATQAKSTIQDQSQLEQAPAKVSKRQ